MSETSLCCGTKPIPDPPVSGPAAANAIEGLIVEWGRNYRGKADDRFVRQKCSFVRRIAREAGWAEPRDLSARSAVWWLNELMDDDRSAKTFNNLLSMLRTFGDFLLMLEAVAPNDHGAIENPFARIPFARAIAGVGSRALELEELARLFACAPLGPIYRVMYGTGLRRGELMQTLVADCELNARPQVVRVRARVAKARREQFVPLAPWVAAFLGELVAGRRPSEPLFPDWPRDTKFRDDFEATGIRDAVPGRVATPHSLRHSFVTHLGAVGVPERIRQELARHADPKLTSRTYTEAGMLPLAAAVARLPEPGVIHNPGKAVASPVGTSDTADVAPATPYLVEQGPQAPGGRLATRVPHIPRQSPAPVLAALNGLPGLQDNEWAQQDSNL